VTDRQKRRTKVKTAEAKIELTSAEMDALLDKAVDRRAYLDWEKKVKERGGSLRGGLFVVEAKSVLPPGPCAELCRTQDSLPGWLTSMERGTVFAIHPGDCEPSPSACRRLTDEEAAAAVSIQSALRVREDLLTIKKAQDVKSDLLSEDRRTEELIEELGKRRLELAEEVEKAERKITEAKRPLDAFFSGWSAERRRAALALAQDLENRRAGGNGSRAASPRAPIAGEIHEAPALSSTIRYGADPVPLSLGEYEIADDATHDDVEKESA
jgi:hypothetical protein